MKTHPIFPSLDTPDIDKWLIQIVGYFYDKGYSQREGGRRNCSVMYCKKFDGYQINVLIYDFREKREIPLNDKADVLYECMIDGKDSNIDLLVYKNASLDTFEGMAARFYDVMKIYSE